MDQCDALNWLSQLGATCLFIPICLRSWRTARDSAPARWSITSHQHKAERKSKFEKRTKTTSRRMMAIMFLAVAIDLILLGVMQADRTIGTDLKQFESGAFTAEDVGTCYTHCKPSSGAAPIYGVLTGIKVLVIIWAALLSLNHSKLGSQIVLPALKHQSLALYNFLFTSVIVLPIILLITIYGSGLVVLLDVLLLWSATFALGAIFLPIAWAEVARKKHSTLDTPAHTEVHSNKQGQKGAVAAAFPLPSIETLDQYQLSTFMLAFDKQVITARRRLLLLEGSTRPMGADKYVPEVSRSVSRSHSAAIRTTHRPGSTVNSPLVPSRIPKPSIRASVMGADSPQGSVNRRTVVYHPRFSMPPAAGEPSSSPPTSPPAVDGWTSPVQQTRSPGSITMTLDSTPSSTTRGFKSTRASPGPSSHYLTVNHTRTSSNRQHMTKASPAIGPPPSSAKSTRIADTGTVQLPMTRSPSPLSPVSPPPPERCSLTPESPATPDPATTVHAST
jgi:hypothetical protein